MVGVVSGSRLFHQEPSSESGRLDVGQHHLVVPDVGNYVGRYHPAAGVCWANGGLSEPRPKSCMVMLTTNVYRKLAE